jgi:hypothetical protein
MRKESALPASYRLLKAVGSIHSIWGQQYSIKLGKRIVFLVFFFLFFSIV